MSGCVNGLTPEHPPPPRHALRAGLSLRAARWVADAYRALLCAPSGLLACASGRWLFGRGLQRGCVVHQPRQRRVSPAPGFPLLHPALQAGSGCAPSSPRRGAARVALARIRGTCDTQWLAKVAHIGIGDLPSRTVRVEDRVVARVHSGMIAGIDHYIAGLHLIGLNTLVPSQVIRRHPGPVAIDASLPQDMAYQATAAERLGPIGGLSVGLAQLLLPDSEGRLR